MRKEGKRVRMTEKSRRASRAPRREGVPLKDVELKLISELPKNSRRSDRELAKVIGASQPTVTRTRVRLEKEGTIKEYTMIPDFTKLGYHLLSLIFVKLKKTLHPEEANKARAIARQELKDSSFDVIMLERGMGLGYDGVIIAFHKEYTSYKKHVETLREYPFLDFSGIDGFLVSLDDKIRYLPLTFTHLANHLPSMKNEK
jgi:DNA-binding Lrp family transcriptional regulator